MIVEVSASGEWYWASNGSLILVEATPEKSGRYLCQVTNGIGQDLNQIVEFVVKGELFWIVSEKGVGGRFHISFFENVSFFNVRGDYRVFL